MQVLILFRLICNFTWGFAQLTMKIKDVKGVIDKRKRKKSGVIEISWEVYMFVQKAHAFREKLKNNKDNKDSEVNDPATSSELVSTNSAIARNECPTPPKSGHESYDHVERHGDCNSPQLDPNKELLDTQSIPLNEEEMTIWLKFKWFDKRLYLIADGIDLGDPKKDRRPIEVDNPFVSLLANFAIAAFNQTIEMVWFCSIYPLANFNF
nr:hypothetical protein [Tanacetum cinerariifolium]